MSKVKKRKPIPLEKLDAEQGFARYERGVTRDELLFSGLQDLLYEAYYTGYEHGVRRTKVGITDQNENEHRYEYNF